MMISTRDPRAPVRATWVAARVGAERPGTGRRGEPGNDESARAGSLREFAPESPFRGLRGESRRLTAAPRAMARLSLLVPDPPAVTGCSACAPATPRTPLARVGPTTSTRPPGS